MRITSEHLALKNTELISHSQINYMFLLDIIAYEAI